MDASTTTCAAITQKKGTPCKHTPVDGGAYCTRHQHLDAGATPEARDAARRNLFAVVRRYEDADMPLRCQHPEDYTLWTDQHYLLRRKAAELCEGCPVFALCREAGRYEHGGVWGGLDRDMQRGFAPVRVAEPRTPVEVAPCGHKHTSDSRAARCAARMAQGWTPYPCGHCHPSDEAGARCVAVKQAKGARQRRAKGAPSPKPTAGLAGAQASAQLGTADEGGAGHAA